MRLLTDRHAWIAGIVLATAGLTPAARADIVWEGKVVPAWPDQDDYATPPYDDDDEGATLYQQANRGFYPSPKGTIYGLTIVVDFSDQAPAFNKTQIDAWLNQK